MKTKFLKGLSLVELMVVAVIAAIVFGALFVTLSSGRTSWYAADAQIALQQELRKAMRQMTEDLHQTGESQISIPADGLVYATITFNKADGVLSTGAINWSTTPVVYSLSGCQVLRQEGIVTQVVANNISVLSFVRQPLSSSIIRINLTAQKATPFNRTLSASLETAAALRN